MEKIQARLMLEILGRPPEHVTEALNNLIKKMGAEKGISITDYTLHEPKKVEDSTSLFTAFAEISLDMDSLSNYFALIFAYLPSHIEIINPERINLTNSDLNEIGNRLSQQLHDYDSIAKKITYDRDILLKKLYEVAPQVFREEVREVLGKELSEKFGESPVKEKKPASKPKQKKKSKKN